MASPEPYWIWSITYRDYYHCEMENGQPRYTWANQQGQQAQQQSQQQAQQAQQQAQQVQQQAQQAQQLAQQGVQPQPKQSHRRDSAQYAPYNAAYPQPQLLDSATNTGQPTVIPNGAYIGNQYEYGSGQGRSGGNVSAGWEDADAGADEEADSVMSFSASGVPTNTIVGTRGRKEKLDPSYVVRKQPKKFFTRGRVFSMLHTEPYGETAPPVDDSENVSVVKFGGLVYTNIRRFVVVKEKKGFCFACPISSYGNRGTLKPGLDQTTHAVIYVLGTEPGLLQGEENLEKSPIAIVPAHAGIKLSKASRINFAMCWPIQHNVKVRDIGCVCDRDKLVLINHWKEEHDAD